MAPERLSRLQRRILTWLLAEETRTRVTMAASHQDLVRALAHDKGNLSTSLKGLAAKGLVTISRTPGGKAKPVDLTTEGRRRVDAMVSRAHQQAIKEANAWLSRAVEHAAGTTWRGFLTTMVRTPRAWGAWVLARPAPHARLHPPLA